MAPRAIEQLVVRLGEADWIDKVAKPVSSKVSEVVPHGPLKDLLSGSWLGHPLHPMLTDLPIGFWTSALAVDLLGGRKGHKAADRLVALGVLSAVPTAAAGLSDWSDTIGEDRRLGFAHAAGNIVAVDLYIWSWIARKRGKRGKGVTLALLGAAAATTGAYLGGHLAWRKGVNVDRHAWDHVPEGWTDAEAADAAGGDGADGQAAAEAGSDVGSEGFELVTAGDDTVLVVGRTGISDVCSHMGGPLHEGEIAGGCATCPWHGSVFRLDDGSVVHGPATGPQPAYDVRREAGRVSVKRRPTMEPAPPVPPASPDGNGQNRRVSSSSTPETGALQA